MVEGRDWSDSQILGATIQQTDTEGKIRYRTSLPSGREIMSEWMRPGDLSGKAVIRWCEFVRQEIDSDSRGPSSPQPAPPKTALPEPENDAVEFAKRQRSALRAQVQELEVELARLTVAREKATHSLEQWERVVDVFRGEKGE